VLSFREGALRKRHLGNEERDAMNTSVALVKCETYSQEQVDHAIARSLGLLGGIERFVKPGQRVLLKVNLLAGAPPEKAVTTHPAVVRAMIRQVRAAGGVPRIGDCSGYEGPPNLGRYYSVCRQSGIKQLCEEERVELLHLSAESVEVENPSGRAFKRFVLAREVAEADVIISLPKLKTHGLTLFTGGVKINFGCLPGLHKAEMHVRAQGAEPFSQMLVDLLLAVHPSLTVMDAVLGMHGNGPRNGQPKQIGAILASTDAVAVDAVACQMVGINPMMVPTTRVAHEQNVGIGDLAQIELLGEKLESMSVADFRLPSSHGSFLSAAAMPFLRSRIVAKPVVAKDRCEGCWTCVEHCPASALSKDGRLPKVDYDRCIRCYCCQEMCPHDAMELRRPLLARLFSR